MLLASSNISGYIDGALTLSVLEYIKDLIVSLIEVIVSFLVLIFVFRLLILLSTKNEEIVILPFEVSTSKKTYNGNIISDSLVVELRKIKEIHEHKFEEKDIIREKIYLPKLTPNTEKLEATVSNLGNMNIAGMSLSMGGILTVLKRIWPLGGQARTIKGSLQEYDSEIHLVALMEGPRVYGWDISHRIEQSTNEGKIPELKIPELIKDLAFMITYDLSKEETREKEGIKAKTWIGLKYFTESLDYYSQYKVTKKPEHLGNAWKNCIKASQEEKDYQTLFNLFYSLGSSYYENADYNSAKDAFSFCITIMPNNEKGFIGLGAPLYSLGQHKEALEAYEKVLQINPQYADAWYNKGVVLHNLGQHKEALEAYEKALEINPENADAWYNKGNVLFHLDRLKEALEVYEKMLEINPEHAGALNNKGRVLENLDRHEEALKAYEKALEIDSKDADVWNNKGSVLFNLGQHKEALKAYEKVLEINPRYVNAWYNKGVILRNLGQQTKALEAYEKALEINSEYAKAWYNKTRVYSMMNKKNEVIINLKRAVELDPSYKERAKNDKNLEKLWEDGDFKEIVTTDEAN